MSACRALSPGAGARLRLHQRRALPRSWTAADLRQPIWHGSRLEGVGLRGAHAQERPTGGAALPPRQGGLLPPSCHSACMQATGHLQARCASSSARSRPLLFGERRLVEAFTAQPAADGHLGNFVGRHCRKVSSMQARFVRLHQPGLHAMRQRGGQLVLIAGLLPDQGAAA